MTQNSISWGDWHTSEDIDQPCPQGCGKHSVGEANDLNQASSNERKAGLRIAHERWIKKGPEDGSSQVSRDANEARPVEARGRAQYNANAVR